MMDRTDEGAFADDDDDDNDDSSVFADGAGVLDAGCGIGADDVEAGAGCRVEVDDILEVTPLGGARGGRVKRRLCTLSIVELSPTALIMVSNKL
jgi:hypothetical protein